MPDDANPPDDQGPPTAEALDQEVLRRERERKLIAELLSTPEGRKHLASRMVQPIRRAGLHLREACYELL
jgi:hypothetical protein